MLQLPEIKPGTCEYELEIEDWLFKLAHFKSKPRYRVPILICYAFINRPYILDLNREVSVISRMLDAGLDVWLIDWGYPSRADRFLELSDYLDFIETCIEHITGKKGVESITLHGYCLGSTLAVIYSSIFPEKIKNLVLQAPAVDFYTTNTLAQWARTIEPEKIARALGNATGDLLNLSFLLVDPIRLVVGKYQSLLDNSENTDFLRTFLYMDCWIFDSPAVPGNVYVEYITRWYHRNEVIEGLFEYRNRKVDINNLTMPTLIIAGQKDHITPPESASSFFERIPSKDKKLILSDRGHIGLTVSKSSHRKIWPEVIRWIVERSR
ncbi:alpha/beta fold hydrolase [Archaeoglobus neptunius]|uniref:alpha/beta fold hydrolase n=1 Tax=Archaeoglobus neptunius TaxID=2798580 RepID=UPI001928A114|nr:alpha/beta fold hydrolase [Archaeoglobus neptunius]